MPHHGTATDYSKRYDPAQANYGDRTRSGHQSNEYKDDCPFTFDEIQDFRQRALEGDDDDHITNHRTLDTETYNQPRLSPL